jgi:transposase InsO family protein
VVSHLREQDHRPAAAHRRGSAHQYPGRALEKAVRDHAAEVADQLLDDGFRGQHVAEMLNLSPRTLRDWRHDFAVGTRPIRALGRPVLRSPRERRDEVIHLIDEAGPAIGVPALREAFPTMPRAELDDLLTRYRRVWRRRHYQPLRVLHWHKAGRVWAIDFTGPLPAIEDHCPYILAVRDLASGRQLLWLPTEAATGRVATDALAGLFALHGAPLVVKCDNGSPFTSGTLRQLNHDAGVEMLFSPPGMPRYNGAIEAGIGSLKTRTEQHAARHGRPGEWLFDDLAAATHEANAVARAGGASADATWASRTKISAEERTLFRAEVNRQLTALDANPETDLSASARERHSIRRALEGLGYLTYTRRRLPLPITSKKVAIIT